MSAAELFLMDGLSKSRVLNVMRPHIFFDDQLSHLEQTATIIPSVLVPFGINNLQPSRPIKQRLEGPESPAAAPTRGKAFPCPAKPLKRRKKGPVIQSMHFQKGPGAGPHAAHRRHCPKRSCRTLTICWPPSTAEDFT